MSEEHERHQVLHPEPATRGFESLDSAPNDQAREVLREEGLAPQGSEAAPPDGLIHYLTHPDPPPLTQAEREALEHDPGRPERVYAPASARVPKEPAPGDDRLIHGESVYAGGDDDVDQHDPDQINVEIEETRVEMSATIDALQEKLSPSILIEQAKEHPQEAVHEATEHAREAVREATLGKAEQMVSRASDRAGGVGPTIMETIRQNPLPAALAGISLGWLFMKRSRGLGYNPPVAAHSGDHYWAGNATGGVRASSSGGIGHVAGQVQDRAGDVVGQVQDQVGGVADRVQERASNVAGQVQERASDMAEHVTDTAGHLTERAQMRARRVQGRLEELLEESPLMAGALALTVGAAIGLTAPSTEQEHALFGETRDNLMRQVRGTARDVGHKVQRVAEQAQDAAMKAAEEQKLTT